jgi:hypothetical protein
MKTLPLIISILAIGLITTAADAHIYTWQDQEGILHFSNTRPLYDENVSIFLREPEADVADENTSPQIDWLGSNEVPAPEAAGSGNLPMAALEDSIAPVDEMESFTAMEYLSDDELPAPAADPYAGDSGDGDDDVSENDREGLYYYLIHKRRHHTRPPLYKQHHRDRQHYGKNKRTLKFNHLSRQPGDKRKQVRQRDSRTRRQTGQNPQFKNRRLKSGKSLQGRTKARKKFKPPARKRQSGVPFRRQHQHRKVRAGETLGQTVINVFSRRKVT